MMTSAKAAAILSFFAGHALALPAATTTGFACNPAHSYPNGAQCVSTNGALSLVTPAPSTTTYACNPAHDYGSGVSCVSSSGTLTLVGPTPSTTTYACNPAHDYGNGFSCVSTNGALSLITSAPAKSTPVAAAPPGQSQCTPATITVTVTAPASSNPSSAPSGFACNPAHSYPGGASCISTNGGLSLVTPTASAAASTKPATTVINAPPAGSSAAKGKCPLDLKAATFEFPHLLEINGKNGYFGKIDRDTNTTFTFDIPTSDAGKTCNTIFALPAPGTMETSSYNLTLVDGAKVTVSEAGKQLTQFVPEPNYAYQIKSGKCPAGGQVKYTMSTGDSVEFGWFQDYNPCALGMYITVS